MISCFQFSRNDSRQSPALGWVALATGLLPLIVVHLCYAVSVQVHHVPCCVPYISGCTSISATGRHGAGYFLFKGGMIPAATLMGVYWLLCRRWLETLGHRADASVRWMLVLGLTSAAFLILYTVFLGSKGDFYNLMRRFGVTVHLSFGVLAQMLLTRALVRLPAHAPSRPSTGVVRAMQALMAALLALGLASIAAGQILADKDRAENAIEWTFAALMSAYYLLTARAWQQTGFRVSYRSG